MGVAFALVFVGLQYLVAPFLIQFFLPIYWEDIPEHSTEFPPAARDFVKRVCAERGLRMPRIGVIQSGTPNAFSFGHTPRDGRVVITTGLIEVLTPDELNAVLAHEIGHVEHWDMATITVASLVPSCCTRFMCSRATTTTHGRWPPARISRTWSASLSYCS